jgi:hypothetical protein
MLELNPNRKVATKGGSVPEFLESQPAVWCHPQTHLGEPSKCKNF